MSRVSGDAVGAAAVALLALVYMSEALSRPFGSLGSPGDGFVPVTTAVFLLLTSAYGLVKELLSRRRRMRETCGRPGVAPRSDGAEPARAVKVMVALVVYTLALPRLGFMIATTVLLFVILRLMRFRSRLSSMVAAVVIVWATAYVFGTCFKVSLPVGIWG